MAVPIEAGGGTKIFNIAYLLKTKKELPFFFLNTLYDIVERNCSKNKLLTNTEAEIENKSERQQRG